LEAITIYRLAHALHELGVPFIPRMMTEWAHSRTGIDIHPGATIGSHFFIDHGTGVVIGETAVVGNDCTLFQDVTLGGTGKDRGDRHPKVGDGVLVCAGAKILGNVRIGARAKVGAASVVLIDVPPGATAVGVPATLVAPRTQGAAQ
jgi:serine O-acetyltransferase